jgi:CelD/BcsL family acetyltransferase involved in cellulose biosynthesis
MIVLSVNNVADLAPYRQRWDELAGDCPFRSWAWLTTWWKHYATDHELHVLLVFDDWPACQSSDSCRVDLPNPETLVAILPMYIESSHTRGRVLRLLGDGEVCSEHLDLICDKSHVAEAAQSIARHLLACAERWDTIQFTTLAEANRNFDALVQEFAVSECQVDRDPGMNLWSIPLPASWDDFLAMQSKSHRKQLRQLKNRILESNRARWIDVRDHDEFDRAWEVLIDLHQRRRQSLGERGCFASPAWANFHREVALELLAAGQLRLSVLELDGRPIAAEYHLASETATYAYQGGIDPDHIADEPGQLSLILCIERAIAAGHERFELLRGDEPYKPHWRAVPTATSDIEIVSPRALARWRHYSWSGLRRAGRWVRQVANLLS